MPWNSLAASDVENDLLPDEIAIVNAIQGASSELGVITTRVINEARAKITVGGNNLDAAGTVPDQLRNEIIDIIVWRWFTSLPTTDLASDARKKKYEDAMERFRDVEAGKDKDGRPVKVEFPASIAGGPAGQMQTASGGGGRKTKGMGGAL